MVASGKNLAPSTPGSMWQTSNTGLVGKWPSIGCMQVWFVWIKELYIWITCVCL